MFTHHEEDSFATELLKIFLKTFMGTVASLSAAFLGMAAIGAVIKRTKVRIVGKDKKIVPIDE